MTKALRILITGLTLAAASAGLTTAGATASPSHPSDQTDVQPLAITWYHGAAPTSGCISHYGYLCAYQDTNWAGKPAYFQASNARWTETANGWIDDESSSWFNNGMPASADSVVIYQDVNYAGPHVCIDRGWGISHYPELSDRVSSNRWVAGPC